jgi:hypothetical protein
MQDPPVGICLEVHEDLCNRQSGQAAALIGQLKDLDFVFLAISREECPLLPTDATTRRLLKREERLLGMSLAS